MPREHDGDTGEVFAVEPGSGSSVDAGSTVIVTYVGKLRVGDVTGQLAADACAALAAQGLKCKRIADDNPVGLDDLGTVTVQNPRAGDEVSTNDEVTISVARKFTMPDLSSQNADAACRSLTVHGVACTGAEGAPGNPSNPDQLPGLVYEQSPLADTTADASEAVAVTYYSGTSRPVGDFVTNQPDYNAAVAACNGAGAGDGYTCSAQAGDPTNDPTQSNVPYDQNPDAGQTVDAGSPVTIYFHTYTPAIVPDIVEGDPVDNACGAIEAAGLVCNRVENRDAFVGTHNPTPALGQDPAPGTQVPPGSTVNVPFSPFAPVQWFRYQYPGTDLFTIATSVPPGWDPGSEVALGWAYQPGFAPNGAKTISEFRCFQGTGDCDGHPNTGNTYFSASGQTLSADYPIQAPARLQTLPDTACIPGGVVLYRVSTFSGNTRSYSVATAPVGGAAPASSYTEPLGCLIP